MFESPLKFAHKTTASNLLRPHSLWNFSGRGIPVISIPNSTYSSSNGTEIILLQNKSPKVIQIYHHYSSYSCSSSYSILWGGIDGINGILFQLYLFPEMLHSIYYSSIPSLHIPKNYEKQCSLRETALFTYTEVTQNRKTLEVNG